ncbi:MAG: TIGR01212 family radical SAM protein [Bacteriovoracaceae bacterium]
MTAPINLYSRYMKDRFGTRIQKISVDAGFTCPNRDGTKGFGGCTFCNNDSFSSGNKSLAIKQQVLNGINNYRKRFPELVNFIVYFQSYSNTYKEVRELEKIYSEALSIPEVVGISIGTRPDCIDKDKVMLLQDIARNYEVCIEYGIESFHEKTLARINRGHSVKDFERAIELTSGKGIKLCTHLILGFPWEGEKEFKETLSRVSLYPLDFIKIHQLQIIKGTAMAKEYVQKPFYLPSKVEYFEMLKRLICHLPKEIVIQRLFSHYPKKYLVTPSWEEGVGQLNSAFISYLQQSSCYQGMALLKF